MLFAVGSTDQQAVDRFLSRFPAEKAADLRRKFASGEVIIAARDPELQRELDAIYNALAKKAEGEPTRLIVHRPGPIEERFIQEYLALVPSTDPDYKYVKAALYATNAQIKNPDPRKRELLDAIYKARGDEHEFRSQRDGRQRPRSRNR